MGWSKAERRDRTAAWIKSIQKYRLHDPMTRRAVQLAVAAGAIMVVLLVIAAVTSPASAGAFVASFFICVAVIAFGSALLSQKRQPGDR